MLLWLLSIHVLTKKGQKMQREQGHRLETAFERTDDGISPATLYMLIMVSQRMLYVLKFRFTREQQSGRSMRDMA